MTKKIAINGFGRIGRLFLRALMQYDAQKECEVVAVNDLASPEILGYLFKYDSVHRRYPGEVKVDGDYIIIDGHKIKVCAEPDPSKLPWKDLGVDVVVESTGRFTDGEKAKAHLAAGAKKVIISAPASNEDITIVMGVNEDKYDPTKHVIISNASCTTNCLAPLVKVLHKEFGILRGLMTTAHSYTNDQVTLDFPHKKDPARGRAAGLSIIPTSTGAAKAIGKVIPELKGLLNGIALRVPTPDVSIVDLVAELKKPATVEEINAAMKKYAEGELKDILAYEPGPLVSADFIGDPHSAIFMPNQTMAIDSTVKVFAWYDNEWGYSCRLVDLTNYVAKSL